MSAQIPNDYKREISRIDSLITQLNPPEIKNLDEPEKVTKYRRELADNILNGDGDLNTIQDVNFWESIFENEILSFDSNLENIYKILRIKSRERYSLACTIISYILMVLIFCIAGAALGISLYTYITG